MKTARWTAVEAATMGPKLYAKCVKLAKQIETQINVCAVRCPLGGGDKWGSLLIVSFKY